VLSTAELQQEKAVLATQNALEKLLTHESLEDNSGIGSDGNNTEALYCITPMT